MRVALTGSGGQLGKAFLAEFSRREIVCHATDLAECDITSADQVDQWLKAVRPDVLINCAAYNLVDRAESDPASAMAVNRDAVSVLGSASRRLGIRLVHYSTDYVFDGRKGGLYEESDVPSPLNQYGLSKRAGELAALGEASGALVLRTSWVYGDGPQNFLYKVRQWAATNNVLRIAADEVSVPTSTEDLVAGTLAALERGLTGLWHLTSGGYASRYEFARHFIECMGLSNLVIPVPLVHFNPAVPRPLFSAMISRRLEVELGISIPSWREGVARYASKLGR